MFSYFFFRVERMKCSIEIIEREKQKKGIRHSTHSTTVGRPRSSKLSSDTLPLPPTKPKETIGGFGGYYPHSSAR